MSESINALILHLQAPLMSFGTTQVDQVGPTGRFPALSQVAGLLANALGHDHRDWAKTQALQDRLSLASLLVQAGRELPDYQTVDLSQTHLREPAWTTRGRPEHRQGGPDARYGTHIRYRRYRADASVLVALTLSPAEMAPTLRDLERALEAPARPLCIGRKCCLPASPVLVGSISAMADLEAALKAVPGTYPRRWEVIAGHRHDGSFLVQVPVADERTLSKEKRLQTERVVDQRDWRNARHGGERVVMKHRITLPHMEGGAA